MHHPQYRDIIQENHSDPKTLGAPRDRAPSLWVTTADRCSRPSPAHAHRYPLPADRRRRAWPVVCHESRLLYVMSHVSYMSWVMSPICHESCLLYVMSHVSYMSWVMSPIRHESCLLYVMSHVSYMSCVMPPICHESCLLYVMSHVSYMSWVTLFVVLGYVIYVFQYVYSEYVYCRAYVRSRLFFRTYILETWLMIYRRHGAWHTDSQPLRQPCNNGYTCNDVCTTTIDQYTCNKWHL